jgi:polyhydroxyalkanoate synthase
MSRVQESQSAWAASQQAMMDEAFRQMQRFAKLPGLWERSQRVRKGVTPSEVIYEEGHIRVLHYLNGAPKYSPPLLLVFALVNRPYILDLKEGRSVVNHFVQSGFDTYLLDWGVPTAADRYLLLEDYIDGYLKRVVDHLCKLTGVDRLSLLGYCMGGTMSTMFTALYPKRVQNLILLAAGIDFATRDGLLNLWTDPKHFDVDRLIDAYGNCPSSFLQSSFQMLKPVQNLFEKPLNFFEKLDDDDFVDDYFAMETWLNDNIPVPGEVFRRFVKDLYQKNLLTQNRLRMGKRLVNLKEITCPVLNLMAQADDLVPCSQSAPFNDLVGSSDRSSITLPAGHIGLAMGGKAQRELWPRVCEWLTSRSDVAAPGPGQK